MRNATGSSGRRLLERAEELAALHEHLSEAAGGRGRLVVIEGPAGIGKSELLRVTLAAAAGRGLQPLSARGSEFEHGVAFGVARQLFEPLLARASADDAATLLAGSAAPAAAILTEGDSSDPALVPRDAEYRTLHALYWMLVNASDRAPLLVGVDDAQWADPASLRLLTFLERRIDGVPALIVATVRSGELDDESPELEALVVGPRTRVLRPSALSPAACGNIVRASLRREPAPEFVAACHRATGGNPYFLHELVAALRQARIEPTADSVDQVLDFDSPAVARMVMHRLARLPDACARVARAAAVLGPLAERPRVGALAALSPVELDDAIARLAAAELVRDAERLEFVHPLVRRAIHAEIAPAERMRLSAAAARELAAAGRVEEAAGHLLDVEPGDDESVLETLLNAARVASGRGAPGVAVRLLSRALREPPPRRRRVEVLRRLGVAEAQIGKPEALTTFARARADADTPQQQAAVARETATACVTFGRFDEAARVLDAVTEELADVDEELHRALDVQRVELAGVLPQLRPPAEVVERVTALSRHDRVAECVLSSYFAYAAMATGQPAREALIHVERALRGDVLAEHGTGSWNAQFRACMMLGFCGEPDRARRHFDQAVEQARRRGAPFELSTALGLRGAMHYLTGDMLAAESDARGSLELIPEEGSIPATYLPLLVDVLLERGRVDEAATTLERAGALRDLPAGLATSVLLSARGRVRAARGELRAAVADQLASGDAQERAGISNPALVPWLSSAALVRDRLGDREGAVALSSENLTRAQRFGAPFVHGRALRVHGVVLGGSAGLRHLRDAVELLTPSYARLELAHARASLGAALHVTGDARGARQELRLAIELAQSLGAEAVEGRATRSLVAAGGRPRRTAARGPSALTPSERRVVEAVAGGMTNRAAAQALFVSEKTVETHLASAYRKLGVASRVQLADALADRSTPP